jgi:hypothetical protein
MLIRDPYRIRALMAMDQKCLFENTRARGDRTAFDTLSPQLETTGICESLLGEGSFTIKEINNVPIAANMAKTSSLANYFHDIKTRVAAIRRKIA